MDKVPYNLRGMKQSEFAKQFRVGPSTISTWKDNNAMPYWASVVPIGPDQEVIKRDAKIERLNIVIDELLKRMK
jgi:hypothetical protein